MRKRLSVMTRSLVMAVVAIGLFGVGATSVSAQTGVVCELNPILAGADTPPRDGIVTIAEMQALANSDSVSEDMRNELLAKVAEAEQQGITGIQYEGCTPDGTDDAGDDTTDATDDTTDATDDTTDATDDTTDATDDTTDATDDSADTGDGSADATDGTTDGSVDGTADGSGDVTGLPETGVGAASTQDHTIAYIVGTGSILLLAGAYMFRLSRKA